MLAATPSITPTLDVRIVGPESPRLSRADLARLFPRVRPDSRQGERLARAPRVEVRAGPSVVGVAVYQRTDAELRVPALGLVPAPGVQADAVLHLLLDTLEAMCLAGGGRRVVVIPPRGSHTAFRRRGYDLVSEGCAGAWREKTLA